MVVEANNTDYNTGETDNGRRNSEPSYLGWLFVCGWIAVGGLLVASIWWPNLTQRSKSFTGNLLNLVIGFAVIAQVLIYRKQPDTMRARRSTIRRSIAQPKTKTLDRSFCASIRAYVFFNECAVEHSIAPDNYPYPKLVLQTSDKTPAHNHAVKRVVNRSR